MYCNTVLTNIFRQVKSKWSVFILLEMHVGFWLTLNLTGYMNRVVRKVIMHVASFVLTFNSTPHPHPQKHYQCQLEHVSQQPHRALSSTWTQQSNTVRLLSTGTRLCPQKVKLEANQNNNSNNNKTRKHSIAEILIEPLHKAYKWHYLHITILCLEVRWYLCTVSFSN